MVKLCLEMFPREPRSAAEEAEIAGKCHAADELREYERQVSWSSGGQA